MRIVVDSSANLTALEGADLVSVPMIVRLGEREYRDTGKLRVDIMLRDMRESRQPTSTACPGVGDWLEAFGEEPEIFAAVLTSKLSGCYSAAAIAAGEYREAHPERKVFVLDSLSTGPELELIAERFAALDAEGADFASACARIRAYRKRTRLAFVLASLDNFARNGRVNPALAKLVTMLHVHIVGRAGAGGDLEPLNKCRGQKKALEQLWKNMRDDGYTGGKVRLRHTENAEAAAALREMILDEYPGADVRIGENRGLCSYYAERGGMLVGYESEEKKTEDPDQAP